MQRAALVVAVVAFILGSEVAGRSDAAETTLRRAPAVGPERPLTDPVPTGARGHQRDGAVAFDGTRYLVTWLDERSGGGIYASRVTTSGTVLDPLGIPIVTAADYAPGGTAVAFDGTNYLVAWTASAGGIRAVRVSRSGGVLDAEPISISTGGAGSPPALVFDGARYLVAWSDGSGIVGARVSKGGTVLDPNGIRMSGTASERRPAIAFDGTNYLIAWASRSGDIYATRVARAGAVLTQAIRISAATGEQQEPAVAFDGTNYFVAWSDNRAGSNHDIYGARVSTAGAVLDPEGIVIASAFSYQFMPSVAFDGTNYLVAWTDYRDSAGPRVFAARVTTAGEVLGGRGISSSMGRPSPLSMAFDGTNFLLVWTVDPYIGSADVYAARVDKTGTSLDRLGFPVPAAAVAQHRPSVAYDGTNHLVVWEEARSRGTDIIGALVRADGTAVNATGIVITDWLNDQSDPAVAFDGTNYLVTWTENGWNTHSDIYAARVSTSGAVLDREGMAISRAVGNQYRPAVAFDGTNHLVSWTDDRNSGAIHGARVSRAGTVLDPDGIPMSTSATQHDGSAIAFDGTNFLVVWAGSGFIYGTRVSKGGVVRDPPGIAIATAGAEPDVAFNGREHLVVWRSGSGIAGARVSTSGSLIDDRPIAIATSGGNEGEPAVIARGAFLVVWTDTRSGSSNIYGGRVSRTGQVLDPDGFPMAASSTSESSAAIEGGSGPNVLAYQRFVRESPYDADRVFVRAVAPK